MTIHINLPDMLGLQGDDMSEGTMGGRSPNDIRNDMGLEPAKEASPVTKVMLTLGREISFLVDEISALAQAIDPALTPEDDGQNIAGESSEKSTLRPSDLVIALDDLLKQVKHQNARLTGIRNRVEL